MIKLLLCISCAAATAILALQLRQEHLNLAFQTNRLHNQIEATQTQLWNQQLNIAISTAPNAIAATVKSHSIQLTPINQGANGRNWAEDRDASE